MNYFEVVPMRRNTSAIKPSSWWTTSKHRHIQTRGTQLLHLTGSLWLLLQAMPLTGRLGERIAHKWKGWMRLHINPELISGHK
jgi:hypothetical protein